MVTSHAFPGELEHQSGVQLGPVSLPGGFVEKSDLPDVVLPPGEFSIPADVCQAGPQRHGVAREPEPLPAPLPISKADSFHRCTMHSLVSLMNRKSVALAVLFASMLRP